VKPTGRRSGPARRGGQAARDETAKLGLLLRVAESANAAESVEEALRDTLREACRYLGWELGHAWLVADEGSGDLVSSGVWHMDDPGPWERLRRLTEEIRLAPGQGIPGRTLLTCEPQWMVVERDPGGRAAFRLGGETPLDMDHAPRQRARAALAAGMRSAFMFPIRVGSQAAGVLEFACRRPERLSEDTQQIMVNLGTQIGRVIERDRARRTLRQREQQLEAVLASLSEIPVTISARDGTVLEMFGAAKPEGYGVPVGEIVGKKLYEWLDPPQAVPVMALFELVWQSGVARRIEAHYTLPRGETWFDTYVHPIRDEAGEVQALLTVNHDVTQRKSLEQALRDSERRLEQLVKERTEQLERSHERLRESERLVALGTFAAGIAHQINNPLGAILLASDYALDASDDPAVVRATLEDIRSEASRAGRIVRGVLEFARGDAGERRRCDLNDIARACGAYLEPQARASDARLRLDLDESPLFVRGSSALDQVVLNVVQNALEAGAQRVALRTGAAEGAVELRVEDDGRGVPKEDLHQLFEPFFSRRPGAGGTGLGLSIAHGIVKSHGGAIEVESEPGKGTAVTIRLPAA
jgi:two-component system NtrC family sensor kinase